MDKKRLMSAVGLIALITLTGAGCSRGSIINNKSNSSEKSGSSKETASDPYKKAIDLELPDGGSKATNKELQDIVEDVLGDTKISSFLQNFPSESSLSVEYTTKRESAGDDLNEFIKVLKKEGYNIDQSGVQDGTAFIYATGSKYTIMLTFEMGTQKVSGLVGPKQE